MGFPPEMTWDQWKYYGMEIGYPPGGEQTDKLKILPSCHTTYAGGNEFFIVRFDL